MQQIHKFTIQQNIHKEKRPNLINRFFAFIKKSGGAFLGQTRNKNLFKKVRSYLPTILIASISAGIIGSLIIYIWIRQDLPDPNKIANRSIAQTTKIYDRTGQKILYEIHGAQKRTLVNLDEISPYILKATIVAEDRDFYTHRGFKVSSYLRALIKDVLSGSRSQGGSTITQQLVKNALLNPEKTYTRKLKELLLSIEIENSFTKDEILKMYLNEIPYGSVIYGIETAAETFFGKTAKEVSLAEGVLLTSLPQSPTYFSPYGSHTDELIARQHWILDSMVDLGYISKNEAEEAKKENVLSQIKPKTDNMLAPHFVFYVREQLVKMFGEEMVERGGLKIITTLDVSKQTTAEKTIETKYTTLKKLGASNAALLSLDPKNGDILAMVGSADYSNDEISGKFNALLGLRQPGSSIKPIIYSTAFEKGYTPDTILFDVTTQFSGGSNPYVPHDYDLKERGPVTVRQALAGSLNIPAVKMLYLTGLDNVLSTAKELGYTTLNDRDRFGLSLALGGGDVIPIEHIAAFSVFANDGQVTPIRAILKVEDKESKVLFENNSINLKRVFSEQTTREINSILSDNQARSFIFGENSALQMGDRPVAAKSGTTNDFKDAWTIGYTPSLLTGVWVGNSNGKFMKSGADGSQIAAPIWKEYMQQSLTNTTIESFTPPELVQTGKPVLDGNKESMVKIKIDSITGLLATEFTPPELVIEKGFGIPHSILYFVNKDDPRGPAPEHPENDPMFTWWDKGVSDWIIKQGGNWDNNPPPTLTDNVHLPENIPSITIARPTSGETVTTRSMLVNIGAQANRILNKAEFAFNGDKFAIINHPPFSGFITIPNRFPKGFYTLTVTVYDDVLNRASSDVTLNLTADTGPLNLQWIAPWSMASINSYEFPYLIKFRFEDNQSIELLNISAINSTSGTEEFIGSIANPQLPDMSLLWQGPPIEGRYLLKITATLKGGEQKTEELQIDIK